VSGLRGPELFAVCKVLRTISSFSKFVPTPPFITSSGTQLANRIIRNCMYLFVFCVVRILILVLVLYILFEKHIVHARTSFVVSIASVCRLIVWQTRMASLRYELRSGSIAEFLSKLSLDELPEETTIARSVCLYVKCCRNCIL